MVDDKNQEQNLEESVADVEETNEELDPREIEMAKDHGIIEGDNENSEEEETEETENTVSDNSVDSTSEDIKNKIKNNENLTEEEEQQIHDWSSDEKAMYWKWKNEKQKRQTEAKRRELSDIKSAAKDKIIEDLKEKINKYADGSYIEQENEDDLITRKEANRIAEEKLKNANLNNQSDLNRKQIEYKQSLATELGYEELAKNPNFEQIQNKFADIIKNDNKLANEFLNRVDRLGTNEFAGDDLINFVYRSVERSGFNIEGNSKDKKEGQEKVDRIIKNSTKPPSSASLGSGSNVTKTLEQYEADDALNMSDEAYRNLSDEERNYLLRKFG